MYFNWLYIFPIINILYVILIGFINKLGQHVNDLIPGLGNGISNFANSNDAGDVWVIFMICTFVICVYSFIQADFRHVRDNSYNFLGFVCLASLLVAFVIVYYFFS